MKRFLLLLILIFGVLGCSCGSQQADITPLVQAVEKTNSAPSHKGDYQLEITFGSGSVLYFSAGDIQFDRDKKTAQAELSTTYLGLSSKVTNRYSDGKMVSVDNGETLEFEESADEVFSHFPYCPIPLPNTSDCRDFQTVDSNGKNAFSFVIPDGKPICDMIIGSDLYELAAVIKEPQPHLTRYGEVACTYSYDQNGLLVAKYSFEVTLFDRQPYTPGHSAPEEEYTLTLKIVARISFDN